MTDTVIKSHHILARLEELAKEEKLLRAELAEAARQRASFGEVVTLLGQTWGGTRAFTILPEEVARERNARVHYGYCDVSDGKGFHWRGGLYFRRDYDGSVVISDWRRIVTDDGEAKWTGIDVARIEADGWASIVASVSAGGEVDGRWQQARDFHATKVAA